ncbi:MAG: hypothetical protein PGN12_16535 [Sphingomonas phyllosphaerae]
MEQIEMQGIAIVLMGTFNPTIITPDWLARHKIIDENEVDSSAIVVIHPEVSQFTVGDLIFEVNTERFVLHVTAEPFVRSVDIVVDIFKDKLSHTPISAMAINYLAHFKVPSHKHQTALGRALAPLQAWADWGQTFEADEPSKVGGLVSLTVQQSAPSDRAAGYVRCTIEPSNRIQPSGTGVFMQVNDHYSSPGAGSSVNFMEVCLDRFGPSMERSKEIVSSMIKFSESL